MRFVVFWLVFLICAVGVALLRQAAAPLIHDEIAASGAGIVVGLGIVASWFIALSAKDAVQRRNR